MIRYLTGACLALALLLGTTSAETQSGQQGPEGTFHYRVIHPTLGGIGTYTNVVRRDEGGVAVATRVDIEAKIAFVTARSVKADRSEYWRDGQLVRYESTTHKGGETIRVQGQSDGSQFVIDGPRGRLVAPPTVVPTNAWSDRILAAEVVMASETGRLYEATVSGGERETVEVNGEPVSARRFRIEADTVYDIWLDDRNRVVRFTTLNDGATVAFVLG